MFHEIWWSWKSKQGQHPGAQRRLAVHQKASIVKEIKRRMGSFNEARKERMLARLGITGDRIRDYSQTGGGAAIEVSYNLVQVQSI
jgi:hypothetical protein